jgi:hypothetical protein
MSIFVPTGDNNFTNLDHVVEVRKSSRKVKSEFTCASHDVFDYTFIDKSGKTIDEGFSVGKPIDFERIAAPVVPAAAGAFAYYIGVFTSDERPTEQDVFVEQPMIAAWRIIDDYAEPIFVERNIGERGEVMLLYAGGRIKSLCDGTDFENLEDAKAQALGKAQCAWDMSRPNATIPAVVLSCFMALSISWIRHPEPTGSPRACAELAQYVAPKCKAIGHWPGECVWSFYHPLSPPLPTPVGFTPDLGRPSSNARSLLQLCASFSSACKA